MRRYWVPQAFWYAGMRPGSSTYLRILNYIYGYHKVDMILRQMAVLSVGSTGLLKIPILRHTWAGDFGVQNTPVRVWMNCQLSLKSLLNCVGRMENGMLLYKFLKVS